MTAQDKKQAKKDVERLVNEKCWKQATPEQKEKAVIAAIAFLTGCQLPK
ncbi:MAG: hypothetical protein U0O22_04005 [Acutalibacteraceae bacterium]